jgi:hypothetical protein
MRFCAAHSLIFMHGARTTIGRGMTFKRHRLDPRKNHALPEGAYAMATKTAPNETDLALTLQFLDFVASGLRTDGETMEAWRSTCPRLSIWEDAVRDGLVRIETGGAMKSSRIVLIERGRARLARGERNGAARRSPGSDRAGTGA